MLKLDRDEHKSKSQAKLREVQRSLNGVCSRRELSEQWRGGTLQVEGVPGVGQQGSGRCDRMDLIYDWSGVGQGHEIRCAILKDCSPVRSLGVLALRERDCVHCGLCGM